MILEGSFGEINDKVEIAVHKVFESSQKLVSIIEDFLSITLTELGRMEYKISEFSLNDLVKKAMAKQKNNFERQGLIVNYEETGEYKVSADKDKLNQVVFNIIDNAGKYCHRGEIKVKINEVEENNEKKVRLIVSDTGIGINPLMLPNIFHKFSRNNDANSTNLIIGTGFGLYVSKQIIDAHSGARIWAESEGKGKGSTFYIELPISTDK